LSLAGAGSEDVDMKNILDNLSCNLSLVLIPDFHNIILEIFDSLVAPTITAPTISQTQIQILLLRKLLSNLSFNVLSQLHLSQVTVANLNQIIIHCFSLIGVSL
jgi:hypothetical protein